MKRTMILAALPLALAGCMEPQAPRGPTALDRLYQACTAGDTNACAQAAQAEAQFAQARAMTPIPQFGGLAMPPPMRGAPGLVNCQSSAMGGFINTTCF